MPATFKDRVTDFWSWYAEVANRFFEAIEQGRCADLTSEVVESMEQTLPKLSWVFGPGEDGGHSFTVTGEGQVAKQLLAEYWHSRAPEIPHWTFYGSRQPSPLESLKDAAISVGDHEQVDVDNFMLQTTVDNDEQAIDLVAWHPALEKLPEEHHYQILFILLDEALGEFGTQNWLGEIKIEPFTPGEGTKALAELPEFIRHVDEYYKWEKLPPLRSYTLYEVPDPIDSRRGDTIVGTTCIPDIVFDFLRNDGNLEDDPLAGTGAEFAYVAIDGSVFPDGKQTDVRANIDDALAEALESNLSGRTLGGACGTGESYIDLLLLDGDNSRKIVRGTLDNLQLQRLARIESFL